MNTTEVAKELVALCEKGEYEEAVNRFYAREIVSIEPEAMGSMPAEMKGFENVSVKTRWWLENHEIHSAKVTGPFVARDKFVVRFDIDVTNKQSHERTEAAEVGIYTVKDGKIVREEFLPSI
jgi:hypothetical protein